MPSDGFSILICTYNRAEILAQTLEGLSKLRFPAGRPAEVVLVANACRDNTEQVGREWAARMPVPMKVVVEPEPGLSVARNRAVREAAHDILIFTDDDVLVDQGWVLALLDIYDTRGERVGVVGGRVELWWQAVQRPDWLPKKYEWLLAGHDGGDEVRELDGPHLFGANFSFRREVFDRAGPFRKDLGRKGNSLGTLEESVFMSGAIRAGYRIFYTPHAHVKHWVLPERVNQKWFEKLLYVNARQRVRTYDGINAVRWIKWIVGGSARFVLYGILRLALLPFGDREPLLLARIGCADGLGTLVGVRDRLLGRSSN